MLAVNLPLCLSHECLDLKLFPNIEAFDILSGLNKSCSTTHGNISLSLTAKKKYLIVTPVWGLVNQLTALANGVAMAMNTNRILAVDGFKEFPPLVTSRCQ